MVAGIGGWLKKNYDRIMAAVALLVLLVSLILLAIQAQVQKLEQQKFDQQLSALTPKFEKAPPADKTVFKNALTALAAPFQTEAWALSLLTPELRVKCVNCDRPIPYAATNCTFAMCGAPQPDVPKDIVDRNHNGIPDEWEEKYGVFSFDPEILNADPDNDGFTTREEYDWKTDPKNPDSHPPYLAKVRVADIKPIPFRMIFKAVSRVNNIPEFQINLRKGGRTYWAKLGACVDKKDAPDFILSAYDEHAPEGPTLTLVHGGKKIPLIKGKLVPRDDYEIKLISLIDQAVFSVRPDTEFELKGSKYRVKKVDTQRKSVLITDPSRDMDVWIERQASETQPVTKP